MIKPSVVFCCVAFAVAAVACHRGEKITPNPPPSGSPTTSPPTGQSQVRAVHGSPDAGPVDVYVYPAGTSLPGSATIANLRYPAISSYVNVSPAQYNVDVFPQGRRSQSIIPTETVSVVPGTQVTAAVTGEVANQTIAYANFIEPVETAGQSAVIVHHAAPGLTGVLATIDPVGIGFYDANVAGGGNPSNGNKPIPAITTQLFSFSFLPGAVGASGPATTGQVSSGEYFLSPLPSTFPTAIGFVAGAPLADDSPLTSIATSALLTQLATNTTLPNATLQNDTSERLPAGAHLSIFAVDNTRLPSNSASPTPVTLIGTLDP